jgi:hypothetical protein
MGTDRLLGALSRTLWKATPWAVRVIGWSLSAALAALAVVFISIPQGVTRLTERWVREAMFHGFPADYYPFLRAGIMVGAFLTILGGWIVLAFITVFLVRAVLQGLL